MKQIEEHTFWVTLDYIKSNLSCKRLADVCRFVSFSPSEIYETHSHQRFEINFIKKGNCFLEVNTERVAFTENEIMIVCPNAPHSFTAGRNGTTIMQLEFLPDIFSCFQFDRCVESETSSVSVFGEEVQVIKIVNDVRIMRVVQRIINELNEKRKYHDYFVVMYYAELLLLIYRYLDEHHFPQINSEPLQKAIAFIRRNYQNEMTIVDIAAFTGIGERYLRKLFSQHLGQTPVDYINRIRINKSVDLLRSTEMSVKEICFTCGFKSPQYFTRLFKKQMGVTPTELLKNKTYTV